MNILITGVAGFIANHLAYRLLQEGHKVVGVDNLSPYYDVDLKKARLARLADAGDGNMELLDLGDADRLKALFASNEPEIVVHLAAQPGIRYSMVAPGSYVGSNLVGFANLLEACRAHPPSHLIFASSSSVYGANNVLPSREDAITDHPLSFYAATKKANEAMAHSYSHLFGLPMTGVRFFTVYGAWGRPDMAFFKFTDAILKGRPIDVYNNGKMSRDFTYIDDVTEYLMRLLERPPQKTDEDGEHQPKSAQSPVAPYKIYNLGNGAPVPLMGCIEILEKCLGRKAEINFLPMQPGEVEGTAADIDALCELIGYRPKTRIETGIPNFIDWYRGYFKTG